MHVGSGTRNVLDVSSQLYMFWVCVRVCFSPSYLTELCYFG